MKKLAYLFLLILASCSSPEKSEDKMETIVEINEDQTPREAVTFIRPSIELPNSVLADLNRIQQKQKIVPYFCQTQDGNLFLISNKNIEASELFDDKNRKGLLYGLVNGDGNILLPIEYEKISNPGIFADGYVEVFKNGTYRLYDYIHKRMMLEEFDVIFPSNIMGYLAIGRRKNDYFKLYEDGTIQKLENEKYFPSYKSITEKLKFDVRSEEFGLWISTKLFTSEYKSDVEAGLYIPPSFVDVLKIIPSFIADVALEGSIIGREELKATKVENKKRNEKINSLVVAFREQGLDGRAWASEQQLLITTNKENKVQAKVKLAEYSDDYTQNICKNCEANGFKFINDSIVQVKNWFYKSDRDAPVGMDSLFAAMTYYRYFEIKSNGKIEQLHKGSLFPIASVVKLTSESLKGCYLKDMTQYPDLFSFPILEDFLDFDADYQMGWVLEFNQLTAGDIRFMINEVYARHGYIFADKSLNAYFRQQTWYKPKTKNVDALLTPVERSNIEFLKSAEKELKTDEKGILQPKRKFMVWAG